jgi:hypothetical protein
MTVTFCERHIFASHTWGFQIDNIRRRFNEYRRSSDEEFGEFKTDYGFVKVAQIYVRLFLDTSNVVSEMQITRRYFSPQLS